MSSVSVLPPHPPSMSAARKLALALAESAQKASSGSQTRNNIERQDAQAQAQDRPPRPSVLNLKVYPPEFCGPYGPCVTQWQSSGPHPVHFLPAQLGSDPLQVTDGQESTCNFTPNVSPLGSGSLDEDTAERNDCRERKKIGDVTQAEPTCQSVGVSTPTQPACSTQSPLTSPVYVNTESINIFNFRAVLAETSMPASIEEVLPRPLQPSSSHHYSPEEDRPLGLVKDVYNNHHHHHHRNRPLQTGRMPAPHCPRPNALPHHLMGPRSMYRQSSESRHSTLGLRHPLSPQYRHYHRDEHLISHRQQGPWQRSEDRIVGHPAIRRARSFHAPHISRYGLAETEALPPDTMFYVEQTLSQDAPCQRLIQTSIQPAQPQFENIHGNYRYSPYSDMNPVDGPSYYDVEPCQQSGIRQSQSYTIRSTRGQSDYYNCSPPHVASANRELYMESRDGTFYEPRDAEVLERVLYQPVKQESKSRCKSTCVVLSPAQSPVSSADMRNRDIVHTRSKSDPGNACLLSASRMEHHNAGVAMSPTSLRSHQVEPDVTRSQYGHQSGAEPGPSRQTQIKQHPPLRKVPSLPERACPNPKSIEHNNRSHTRGHDPDRLMMTSTVNSYSGVVKPSILRRPGRSQSTRENRHHYHQHGKSPVDPEHLGSFSSQLNRRTQSTKVRPTQYDHMEGYYAAPKPKPSKSGKAVAGYLPGQGCMSPRGQRLLSKALGHEAFYHAALRSEAGVYD